MATEAFMSALFAELGAEIRSRRDPEHIYTAAAVGACAAISGGVAAVTALATIHSVPFWRHPAFLGAVICLLLGFLVVGKIEHEHQKYKSLREAHAKVAQAFASAAGNDASAMLPSGLQLPLPAAGGYLHSSRMVMGTALSCAGFCLAVWYGTIAPSSSAAGVAGQAQPASSAASSSK